MELATCCVCALQKFLEKLLEKLWDYPKRQVDYLIYFHRNVEELKKKVEELKNEQGTKQHLIDEAQRRGENIVAKVQNLTSKVDEIIARHAQQFSEENNNEANTIRCSQTSCSNPWSRYQTSKRAKKMKMEVVEILRLLDFDKVSYLDAPQWIIPDSANEKSNEGFESRVPIMKQIMEALKDPSVSVVGLYGLPGVGKTTIANEVAKKARDENMFKKVSMAIVSHNMNLENIQDQIAEMLGMKLDEKTESTRAFRLCERMKKEKNMLLILDDLWEELDLAKVGIPFINDIGNHNKIHENAEAGCSRPKEEEEAGCKVLLTSRNEKLLSNQMRCERTIKVDVLDDKESWDLFQRIAGLSTYSNSPDLMTIATEIVQKCGGLPLAIVVPAGALRGKDLTEWRDFLKRLKNPLRRNTTGIKEVDSILKLSYDHLSSEHKPIFLLSAMLSPNTLVKDLLISSSHSFTIHDVIRDVALSIASNEQYAFIVRHRTLNEWPDENALEGYKGICLEKSDIGDLPEELNCPRLEFFLLNSTDLTLTIPSMFFRSAQELRLLGFSNMKFSSLPSSLRFLEKLRTFCLHSCFLEDITEVRSLKNLKILSLAYSEIERLPIELGELTSLQMLNWPIAPNSE
ncbi:probable disease resistance protein At1g52660 [Prosopis cineraria]|uniref:probable disease resistance protein At1g52660 n=1 Tax=Prosopis cineraria TaxID=364024 RepID=UPI00240EA232|nr:probable disease resistance protein At1g52660 [Prosopis cineraria]